MTEKRTVQDAETHNKYRGGLNIGIFAKHVVYSTGCYEKSKRVASKNIVLEENSSAFVDKCRVIFCLIM